MHWRLGKQISDQSEDSTFSLVPPPPADSPSPSPSRISSFLKEAKRRERGGGLSLLPLLQQQPKQGEEEEEEEGNAKSITRTNRHRREDLASIPPFFASIDGSFETSISA